MLKKRMMKRKRLNSCKGSVTYDSIIFVVIVVIFVIVGVLALTFATQLNNAFKSDNTFDADKQAQLDSAMNRLPTWLDGAVLFIIIGFWIAVVIGSLFIDTHPVFFIVTIVVGILLTLVGASITEFWTDFNNDPDISGTTANLPITNFVFNNFPYYVLVVVFTIGVVLYGKSR